MLAPEPYGGHLPTLRRSGRCRSGADAPIPRRKPEESLLACTHSIARGPSCGLSLRLERLARPRDQILMADDDPRAAGFDVREAPGRPARDHRYLLGRDFTRRTRPPFNQLMLEIAGIRVKDPIAPLTLHVISGRGERPLGVHRRVGPSGSAESLVAALLMAIHQRSNAIVFPFRGPALETPVV